MPRALAVPVALAALLAVPAVGRAERRAFPHAYEYGTTVEAQTDVELHSSQTRATWKDGAEERFDLALELAHGLSDRWDVSLYHRFAQSDVDGLRLSAIEAETRYRLAERGEWPVDLGVVAALGRGFGASAYAGRVTAVLARDFGALSLVANLRGDVSFGADVIETELAAGYGAGASYEVTPTWKLGAESWGQSLVDDLDGKRAWAGPAASWAPNRGAWITASAGFGLTDRSDRFVVSGLIGLSL
jgi:hypothetical protein